MAETGIPFSYMVVLFEADTGGSWIEPEYLTEYRKENGAEGFPLLADLEKAIPHTVPFTGTLPVFCALSDEMVMMACYTGETGHEDEDIQEALDLIVADATGG